MRTGGEPSPVSDSDMCFVNEFHAWEKTWKIVVRPEAKMQVCKGEWPTKIKRPTVDRLGKVFIAGVMGGVHIIFIQKNFI